MAGNKNYYLAGSHNVICDRCGKKHKSADVREEWTGLIVCNKCWEPRHAQDFVQSKLDKISVPFSRPRPPDVFILREAQNESISVIENIVTSIQMYRSISETISILETLNITKAISLADTETIVDAIVKTFNKQLVDTELLQELITKSQGTSNSDVTTILENLVLVLSKVVALTDIQTISSSGSITIPTYAIDFFAEDYTLTTQSFT